MVSHTATKIVFLDMDGPICNRREHWTRSDKVGGMWRTPSDAAIGFLNILYYVDPAHTRFVVCSDWRRGSGAREKVTEFLSNAKFVGEYHADWATPIQTEREDAKGHGNDVTKWLSDHPEITTWIAIDDSTIGYGNDRRLIKADPEDGLLMSEMKRAVRVLHGMDFIDGKALALQNREFAQAPSKPRV